MADYLFNKNSFFEHISFDNLESFTILFAMLSLNVFLDILIVISVVV